MTKKSLPTRRRRTRPPKLVQGHQSLSDDDLYFIAQAVHKAAKKLAATVQLHAAPLGEFAFYPVLHLYRHAVELYLKDIVLNDGGNFLAIKPDHISVSKSRSVSWLGQFVVQIVTGLRWEEQFRCEGIEDIVAFREIIEEVNRIDVGHPMFRVPGDAHAVADEFRELTRRLDALLELLDRTADSLAAEWDLQTAGEDMEDEVPGDANSKETIH